MPFGPVTTAPGGGYVADLSFDGFRSTLAFEFDFAGLDEPPNKPVLPLLRVLVARLLELFDLLVAPFVFVRA